jgi:hypothetical protein
MPDMEDQKLKGSKNEVVTEEMSEEKSTSQPSESKDDKNNEKKSKYLSSKKSKIKNFFRTKKHRVLAIIIVLLIAIGVLIAIPTTRYSLLGWIVKKDVHIVVFDAITKRPVSDATVSFEGKSVVTDKDGKADIRSVSVGISDLSVVKKYYKTSTESYTVPVFSMAKSASLNLIATGRQITLKVTNKITGDALASVKISSAGTSATTDAQGIAIIILPTTKSTQSASLSLTGFNTSTEAISVNNSNDDNIYSLTPSGTIYFLSDITGTTNIMESNLDGSGSNIVVPGTGNESSTNTTFLSTTDWQYMALLASRESDGNNRVYIFDDKTKTLKLIDETGISYQFIGWSGHDFFYIVNRQVADYWTPGANVIKSYNADTGKTTTIDQSDGAGDNQYDDLYNNFNNLYIIDGKLIYTKTYYAGQAVDVSNITADSIVSSDASGNKKDLKDFSQPVSYLGAVPYDTDWLYFQVGSGSNTNYYEYEDGIVKSINLTSTQYSASYPTYLFSPSTNKTLWYQVRNSKNTIFVGDNDGNNAKQIDTLSDYTPYGWYGEDYIILHKDGELYITSANRAISTTYPPLKIGSYQPTTNYYIGYGSGYGGQ